MNFYGHAWLARRAARGSGFVLGAMLPDLAGMARLRLDYESVRAVKPDIVYCGAVGFGRGGRYAARPAYDDVIQGLTALPSLLGRIRAGISSTAPGG